jgi:large repetitive protein
VRYEGVLRAKTSVALVAGVILVVTGCGRVASHVTTSPVAEVSPSTAATPSTTVESPAATTPGAAPTVPATHPPSPRSAPSPTPRSSASAPATPPPLAIAGVTFPTGEVGISYPTILLAASGGTPPYTWSIGSGALPGGLTLSSSTISGTPTVAGPFPFTLNLADSAGGTASAAQSVTTVAALSVAGRCDANPCSVEQGCDATCGSFGSQSGGLAPFKYSPSGQLPPGTSLNGLALGGQFTTVSAAAPFTFAVTVTDALGASGGVKAAFNVFPHISLQGATVTQKVGLAFTVPLPYSGGTPGGVPKVSLAKGTLPLGATVSVDPKGSQVVVSVPAQRVAGNYLAVLVLTDASPCSAGANCAASATVTINLG